MFLGGSGVSIGVWGVLISSYGIDGTLYRASWIAFFFALVGSGYLALKSTRVLFTSIFPFFFLVQTFLPSLPFIVAFAGSALVVGILNAYDFSRLDVTACMEHAETRLRAVLAPFSRAEGLAGQIVGRRSRPLLFSFYLSLSAAIVAVPVLAYLASDGNILFDVLPLISLIYLVVAWEECAKGVAHLKDSP